jgi:hypothetical protein
MGVLLRHEDGAWELSPVISLDVCRWGVGGGNVHGLLAWQLCWGVASEKTVSLKCCGPCPCHAVLALQAARCHCRMSWCLLWAPAVQSAWWPHPQSCSSAGCRRRAAQHQHGSG